MRLPGVLFFARHFGLPFTTPGKWRHATWPALFNARDRGLYRLDVAQLETQPSPATRSTRPCVICREQIDCDAIKCTKCGSYQDWSRHIFRWSGVVVAAVALAPLWSMAVSLYQIAMPRNAEIHLSALTCTAREITVAAANVGQKTGAVKSVDFEVARNPPQKESGRDSRTLTTDQIIPIKPNDVVILKYRPSPGGFEELPLRQSSTRCEYRLSFTALGLSVAESGHSTVTCDCPT